MLKSAFKQFTCVRTVIVKYLLESESWSDANTKVSYKDIVRKGQKIIL